MIQKNHALATAGGIAAAAAAAGGAQAADMAMKAPMAPAAAPSWAGWYLGASVGGAWERTTANPVSPYATFVLASGAPTSASGGSFIGGVEIGYNWQAGNIVYGLEADISGVSGKTTNTLVAAPLVGAGTSGQLNWLDTVRARLGTTIISPNLLAYVTGGLAVGGVKDSFNFGDNTVPFVNNKSVSKTKAGWTVGGGLQYMITPHWIVGAEGLFVNLGNSTISMAPTGTTKTTTFHNTAAIGRLKVDYKF